jgi:hypothetical protein
MRPEARRRRRNLSEWASRTGPVLSRERRRSPSTLAFHTARSHWSRLQSTSRTSSTARAWSCPSVEISAQRRSAARKGTRSQDARWRRTSCPTTWTHSVPECGERLRRHRMPGPGDDMCGEAPAERSPSRSLNHHLRGSAWADIRRHPWRAASPRQPGPARPRGGAR